MIKSVGVPGVLRTVLGLPQATGLDGSCWTV